MAIILTLIIIFIIGFCVYNNHKKLAVKQYPLYYRDVWIRYQLPGKDIETKLAWLSVNDNLDYIWTLVGTDIIILDKYVIDWENIK